LGDELDTELGDVLSVELGVLFVGEVLGDELGEQCLGNKRARDTARRRDWCSAWHPPVCSPYRGLCGNSWLGVLWYPLVDGQEG
jgi:hypothetical protein